MTSMLVLCARKVPHRTQHTQDASVPVRTRAGIIHSHSTTRVGSHDGVSILKISAWKNSTETASKIRTFPRRFWNVAADFDPDCPYCNGANPCLSCSICADSAVNCNLFFFTMWTTPQISYSNKWGMEWSRIFTRNQCAILRQNPLREPTLEQKNLWSPLSNSLKPFMGRADNSGSSEEPQGYI